MSCHEEYYTHRETFCRTLLPGFLKYEENHERGIITIHFHAPILFPGRVTISAIDLIRLFSALNCDDISIARVREKIVIRINNVQFHPEKFDYSLSKIPKNYKCYNCEITGVKLWLNRICGEPLLCAKCVGKQTKRDISDT